MPQLTTTTKSYSFINSYVRIKTLVGNEQDLGTWDRTFEWRGLSNLNPKLASEPFHWQMWPLSSCWKRPLQPCKDLSWGRDLAKGCSVPEGDQPASYWQIDSIRSPPPRMRMCLLYLLYLQSDSLQNIRIQHRIQNIHMGSTQCPGLRDRLHDKGVAKTVIGP